MKHFAASVALSFASLAAALTLSGCSANFGTITAASDTSQVPLGTIKGSVHGGQQPIVGAYIYLFATGASTFDGSSISQLSNTGHTDTNGNSYVVTDSNGDFNITGDYSCTYSATAPQVLYLYSINGNPGSGTNPSAGLMAVLGTCPSSGTFSGQLPFVYMNEVSTVAAAYALAGYAADATDISVGGASGSTNLPPTVLADRGLMNAAANANQLYQVNGAGSPTLAANSTTPGSTTGNVGTVPAALINSIANSLAACINSGSPFTPCSMLFSYLPVGPSGATPTDTATAAIYIAKHPAINVPEIFAVGGPNPVFNPTLATSPYDFTVAINYTAPNLANPVDVAIDAVGNAWVTSPSTNTLTELSNTGVATSYTEENTSSIAIDTAGNGTSTVGLGDVFTTSPLTYTSGTGNKVKCNSAGTGAADCLYEVDSTGTADIPTYLTGAYKLIGSTDIVSSGTYNYIADLGDARVVVATEASPAAGESDDAKMYKDDGGGWTYLALTAPQGYLFATAPSTGYICRTDADTNDACTSIAINTPGKVAIDSTTDAWVPDTATNALYRVIDTSPTTISLNPTGGYTGGGLDAPFGVAIDGNGTVWTTNTGSISFGKGNRTCTGCSISAFYSTGSGAITPGALGTSGTTYYNPIGGYTSGNTSGTVGYLNLAVDGSGDLWITNNGENSVTEIIGVASPTVTPLSYAVASQSLGLKP